MAAAPSEVGAGPTPRSLLFAPGADAHKLGRALRAGAALVVADLEDAVAEAQKAAARDTIAQVLGSRTRDDGPCAVRVNALDGPHAEADLAMAVRAGADAVVIPKASAAGLRALDVVGLPPILAIVETAAGLQESAQIAAADGIWALVLGAVDLGKELRLTPRTDGLELLFARSKLVIDSAAAAIAAPIDSVSVDLAATDALREECRLGRSLGFGGKACIHPRQVPVVEAAFAPSSEESAWARRVVAAYEAAVAQGDGVVNVEGEMVDLPVYHRAQEIVNDTRMDP